MRITSLLFKIIVGIYASLMLSIAEAGKPMWTLEPLTATTVSVPSNGTTVIQYRVTNQLRNTSRTLVLEAETTPPGVSQITTGLGVCGAVFVLQPQGFCILSLQVNGSQLTKPVSDGPWVCQQGITKKCFRPADPNNVLRITQTTPSSNAVISVSGSPLSLAVNGVDGSLTINNTSLDVAATNIMSDFTGTALAGNVTETGNTCANVPPGGSCTLTYTPGSTAVPQTNFSIYGSNTNVITAAIAIQSGSTLSIITPSSGTASGGTGVTLTGTGLTGATSVTFGGIAATSVNVIDSNTVTAVTPAHVAGAVNVSIATPAGGATLVNGYTYIATAVGQSSGGGTIACLGGGLQNLIASTADNATSNPWWEFALVETGAQSFTDGAANTNTIVSTPGSLSGYAANICDNYAVDSLGNTPCQAGNTCYNDWFLPARDQLSCLYNNRAAIGGFSTSAYFSSTELNVSDGDPVNSAWAQTFLAASSPFSSSKGSYRFVRCVRAFTP